MIARRSIAAVLFLICAITVSAQTETVVFNPAFKSLQTKVNGNDQMPPVIVLGSDDVLEIEFDELSSERRYIRYELYHCDALWQRDTLLPSDYLDGFNEGLVDEYEMSSATLIQYIHYRIEVPNPDMHIRLSGNYLLRAYDENDPDETLFQARFSVVEPQLSASASVTTRTDIDYNREHQQLSLTVDMKDLPAGSAMNDLIVTVTQNGREDNRAVAKHPTLISGRTAVWEHCRQLIFPAGNEYHRMETVSTNYPGMHVEEIGFDDPYYIFRLVTDSPRREEPYLFDETQKGRFRIDKFDCTRPDTEAEYVMVLFTLDMPEMEGADIFIDGDMFQRRFSPESLMVYNRATGRYEASALLKQGSYNYGYLAVSHGSMRGDAGLIDGNKYQTANEYLVKVYYREPGGRYDRLVAVTTALAGK